MRYNLRSEYSRQKSFYGKAIVTEYNNRFSILTSYTTEVAMIKNGIFYRLWNGYSVTTQNHINEYRQQNGMEKLSKSEWLSIPVNTENPIIDIIQAIN